MPERQERVRVSVVIPIRNSASYLEACCQSVQEQSYPDWEAILIDDNSSDASADIAARFARLDPRFRLIRSGRRPQDAPGPWLPRNRGLQAARGAYVAFLDADDLWLPDKLTAQLNLLEQGQHDLCICPYYRFSEKQGWITECRHPPTGSWHALLKIMNPIPLSTVVIRRDLMVGGFRAVCHEDYDAWQRLFAAHTVRYVSCAQTLAAYRIHPQNLTGSWRKKLAMKKASQATSQQNSNAATWIIFLLIHSLYFLKSLPWRLRRRSIESLGFTRVGQGSS